MEEFISVSHHTTCDNLTLMEKFRSGLDDEIWMVMPKGDSCWTLGEYINFALWVNGSSFTVDKVEADFVPSVQSHYTSLTTPAPEPKPTVDKEPEPTAERETQLMPTTDTVSEPTSQQPRPPWRKTLRSHLTRCVSRLLHLCQLEY